MQCWVFKANPSEGFVVRITLWAWWSMCGICFRYSKVGEKNTREMCKQEKLVYNFMNGKLSKWLMWRHRSGSFGVPFMQLVPTWLYVRFAVSNRKVKFTISMSSEPAIKCLIDQIIQTKLRWKLLKLLIKFCYILKIIFLPCQLRFRNNFFPLVTCRDLWHFCLHQYRLACSVRKFKDKKSDHSWRARRDLKKNVFKFLKQEFLIWKCCNKIFFGLISKIISKEPPGDESENFPNIEGNYAEEIRLRQ